MGRILAGPSTAANFSAAGGGGVDRSTLGAGHLGIFGTGNVKTFYKSSTFVVPAGGLRVRVRVCGAGGDGGQSSVNGATGGTSSFGALISATGGAGGIAASTASGTALGGVGIGGDFQAAGGSVIKSANSVGLGGGGAGSQLGDGGTSKSSGGGAVGGLDAFGTSGASPFGAGFSNRPGPSASGWVPPHSYSIGAMDGGRQEYAPKRFPFEFFDGAGGGLTTELTAGKQVGMDGGAGAGGAANPNGIAGSGGDGGGGGGVPASSSSNTAWPGRGGLGGGGGGMALGGSSASGGAGGGYAYGVFDLPGGQTIPVTVGLGGTFDGGAGGNGHVVVEW